MVEYKLTSSNTDETMEIGRQLAKFLMAGDVVAFWGDLGSGKTYFIKGICEGLKIEDDVTSPTFTIMNIYEGDLSVYHFDFYRIDMKVDVYGLGYEEYFYGNGICLIEWANRIESFLPDERIEIHIDNSVFESSDDERHIVIRMIGQDVENRSKSDSEAILGKLIQKERRIYLDSP